MQQPCHWKCLPTQSTWYMEKCPGKGGINHCVDCYGFLNEDEIVKCALCGDCWCINHLGTFARAVLCQHFDKSKADMTEKEIEERAALEKGICPSCFLNNPLLHCTSLGCDLSYAVYILSWIEFCSQPINLGTFEIVMNERRRIFELYVRRVPKAGNAASLWPVDKQTFYYNNGRSTQSYHNIDDAIEEVKFDIQKILKLQTSTGCLIADSSGILLKSRLFPPEFEARDHSPVRKSKK